MTRPVFDVPDEEIEEQVKRVAESARSYEPKDGKAEDGDRVTIDYVGTIDGTPFEGGAGNGHRWCLARRSSSPASRTSLLAPRPATKADHGHLPRRLQAPHLAGKDADFDVTVKQGRSPARSRSTTTSPSSSASNARPPARDRARPDRDQFG